MHRRDSRRPASSSTDRASRDKSRDRSSHHERCDSRRRTCGRDDSHSSTALVEIQMKSPSSRASSHGRPRSSSRGPSRSRNIERPRVQTSARSHKSTTRPHEPTFLKSKSFDEDHGAIQRSTSRGREARTKSPHEQSVSRHHHMSIENDLEHQLRVEHNRSRSRHASSTRRGSSLSRRSSQEVNLDRVTAILDKISPSAHRQQSSRSVIDKRRSETLSRKNADDFSPKQSHDLSRRSSDGILKRSCKSPVTDQRRVSDILDKISSLHQQQDSSRMEKEDRMEKQKNKSFVKGIKHAFNGVAQAAVSTTTSVYTVSTENSSGVSQSSIDDNRKNGSYTAVAFEEERVVGRPKFISPLVDEEETRKVYQPSSSRFAATPTVTIDQRPYLKSSSQPTPPSTRPCPPPPPRRLSLSSPNVDSPPIAVTTSQSGTHQWRESSTLSLMGESANDSSNAFSFRSMPPPPPPRRDSTARLPLPPPRDETSRTDFFNQSNQLKTNVEHHQTLSTGRAFDDCNSHPMMTNISGHQGLFRSKSLQSMVNPTSASIKRSTPSPSTVHTIETTTTRTTDKATNLLSTTPRASRVVNQAHIDQHGDGGLYTGEVNEGGLPHGKGKMKYDNGVYYEGKWNNGCQDSAVQRDRMLSGFSSWKGQPKNKTKGEKGSGCTVYGMDWIDFSGMAGKYTGDVNDDNIPDGKGVMKYDFGLIAEGEWIKGVLNGGSQNGQMAGGATVIPGGTVIGGGGFPAGMSVVGGGDMSVVSGLGMVSISGAALQQGNRNGTMMMPNTMMMNGMPQMHGYSMPPGYSYQ